jgi:hypothetical protein
MSLKRESSVKRPVEEFNPVGEDTSVAQRKKRWVMTLEIYFDAQEITSAKTKKGKLLFLAEEEVRLIWLTICDVATTQSNRNSAAREQQREEAQVAVTEAEQIVQAAQAARESTNAWQATIVANPAADATTLQRARLAVAGARCEYYDRRTQLETAQRNLAALQGNGED